MSNMFRSTLIFVFAFITAFSATARGEKIAIPVAGSPEEISAFNNDNIQYVSLSELAEHLDSRLDWEVAGQEVTFADPSLKFTLIVNSPFFKYNDSLYNMVYPTVMRDGQLYVPAETFLPYMAEATPKLSTWAAKPRRTGTRSSDNGNRGASVTDIEFSPRANGLLIQVYCSDELAYDAFLTTGNWLNISIRNGKLDQDKILSRRDNRFMYDMKCYQEGATGQISIRLRSEIKNWTHKFVDDPDRIQISIADVKFRIDSATAAATIGKPRTKEIGPDGKIDVVVIDPGHGGTDYGAIGPTGTREKDVALAIAKELARQLKKQKGFQVILTRESDKYIPLPERAEIANRAKADLFISIHANANPRQAVKGWNVFFLAPAKNDSARAVEQLENSYYLREASATQASLDDNSPDAVVSILNEMIMTEFQSESHDLAMLIDREFRRTLGIPARGVDQAGFVVLNKVFTPSVLVESAFISNPQEEKLLKDKVYQAQVAMGIVSAILQFKDKYESQ